MSIRVQSPGLLTTLQDLGRHGHEHLGVGPGGAMDPVSHRLASLLVGNPPELPSLEITLSGPVLDFAEDALIALAGADLAPEADGLPVPLWRPVLVRAGTRLRFGKALDGCRCYLAVAGGFGWVVEEIGPDAAPDALAGALARSADRGGRTVIRVVLPDRAANVAAHDHLNAAVVAAVDH